MEGAGCDNQQPLRYTSGLVGDGADWPPSWAQSIAREASEAQNDSAFSTGQDGNNCDHHDSLIQVNAEPSSILAMRIVCAFL